MAVSQSTDKLLRHLASRPGHDEVKADFRQLLIEEFGADLNALEFERRVPEVRGRLDAIIGRTIFEAKSNLDREWVDVERRMPAYLADREREEKQRFVGIASDGYKWAVFELANGELRIVKRVNLEIDRPIEFLTWLDGAVALKASLPPDALTIRSELGQDSVAFRLINERLISIWGNLKLNPNVLLKRQLWAQLLRHVYGRDVETDSLWLQHTFLVIVAKCIAHAVLGVEEGSPERLLSGEAFVSTGVNGAVESDFFDWILSHDDGKVLVSRIMNHVRRFRLDEVESDVLKVLYESLIDRAERHGLGEYYTPDWLAAKVIKHTVDRALEQRVLDPACGSGTFLFHAVRNFLREAEDADMDQATRAREACSHVAGVDIHPVAVIIARVTYLLALAPALAARAGALSIPVYLGDSMQLSISEFMAGKHLTIRVPSRHDDGSGLGSEDVEKREQLSFPEVLCREPALFDKIVERMRVGSHNSMSRAQIETAVSQIIEKHYRTELTFEQRVAVQDIGLTFVTFDRLRREGRDTVWAYVARNLSRPLAFSASGGWANVVVGNPPWVAFRHMSADLQRRFKDLAKGERVYVARVPSQNDLCALFVVRCTNFYLRSGGKLAFILPLAALRSSQFEKFRSGSFHSTRIAWDDAWTMDESVGPLFPVPSCVVFGRRRATATPMPTLVRAYSGTLPYRDAPEVIADSTLKVEEGAPAPVVAQHRGGSSYRTSFRNGATLFPRMLVFVQRPHVGRLGGDLSAPHVVSRRSSQEKLPWKTLPAIENRVEAEFIRPVLLGESILPYRQHETFEAVVPISGVGEMMDAALAANRGYDGLHGWMKKAEGVWDSYKKSKKMTLIQLFDYFNQLTSQFPIPNIRVVYSKAGTYPAACIVRDRQAIVENLAYWAPIETESEALYLTSILNSEAAREKVESMQSRGSFGPRHFDKVMFNLPIPRFDEKQQLHVDLSISAQEAVKIAATVIFPAGMGFRRKRSLIRNVLVEANISAEIDKLVRKLLAST